MPAQWKHNPDGEWHPSASDTAGTDAPGQVTRTRASTRARGRARNSTRVSRPDVPETTRERNIRVTRSAAATAKVTETATATRKNGKRVANPRADSGQATNSTSTTVAAETGERRGRRRKRDADDTGAPPDTRATPRHVPVPRSNSMNHPHSGTRSGSSSREGSRSRSLSIIPTVAMPPLTLPAPDDSAVRATGLAQSARADAGMLSLEYEHLIRMREGHFYRPRPGRRMDSNRNWNKLTISEAAWTRLEEIGIVTKGRAWTAREGYDEDGEPVKPDLPYVMLTKLVIASSPRKMLTLNQIYHAMEERWPYFRDLGQTFRNSIRHNLSMNPAFVNVERPVIEGGLGTGKGGYWRVSDDKTKSHRGRAKKPRYEMDPSNNGYNNSAYNTSPPRSHGSYGAEMCYALPPGHAPPNSTPPHLMPAQPPSQPMGNHYGYPSSPGNEGYPESPTYQHRDAPHSADPPRHHPRDWSPLQSSSQNATQYVPRERARGATVSPATSRFSTARYTLGPPESHERGLAGYSGESHEEVYNTRESHERGRVASFGDELPLLPRQIAPIPRAPLSPREIAPIPRRAPNANLPSTSPPVPPAVPTLPNTVPRHTHTSLQVQLPTPPSEPPSSPSGALDTVKSANSPKASQRQQNNSKSVPTPTSPGVPHVSLPPLQLPEAHVTHVTTPPIKTPTLPSLAALLNPLNSPLSPASPAHSSFRVPA